MNRITKFEAEQIAKALVKPKRAKLEKAKNALRDELQKRYRGNVPFEVWKAFSENEAIKPYISYGESLYVSGGGIYNIYFSLEKPIPRLANSGNLKLNLEGAEGEKFAKAYATLEDKRNKISALERQIGITLLELKTYKKIEVEFPEASPFLNKENKTQLPSIQLVAVRDQLNSEI